MQIKLKIISGAGPVEAYEFSSYREAIAMLLRKDVEPHIPKDVHASIMAIPKTAQRGFFSRLFRR